MERELTVRHVFVGFVERQESGVRNAEFATLSNVTCRRILYCWFSHDVTKIQTKKLSILPRFYFHDALEQLKTANFRTNVRFKRVLGFVTEYA